MAQTIIEWDGRQMPEQLRGLPPGRYLIEPLDDVNLTPEEEAGIAAALDAIDAGRGISLADVVSELREEHRRR
jgi:hypothetical protein